MPSDFDKIVSYGSTGTGNSNLDTPVGMATDGTYIYIVDFGNHRIQKWTLRGGSFVANIGSSGTGDNNFSNPEDIMYYKGLLFISDTQNDRIKIHKADDLRFVKEFGTTGSGSGNFNSPRGLTNDGKYLYIADHNNARIVIYNLRELTFEKSVSITGTPTLTQIAYDNHEKVLYVTDSSNKNILKMRADDLSLTILSTTNITSSVMRGINIKDHYVYLLNTTATGTVVIQVYDSASIVSKATKTITKTGSIGSRIILHRNVILWSDEASDEINIYYNYKPERAFDTGESITIFGDLFQNPVIPVGGKQDRVNVTIGGTTRQDLMTNIEEERLNSNFCMTRET